MNRRGRAWDFPGHMDRDEYEKLRLVREQMEQAMKPKDDPEDLGEYCPRCDSDTHICPGCGDYLKHGETVCEECKREVENGTV